MIAPIVVLALTVLVAAWYLFEYLWDKRQFGRRSDSAYTVNLRAKDAAKLLRERPDLLVLDVRSPASYEAGHLPGAGNTPFLARAIDTSALDGISRDRPIFVYCDGGYRSRRSLRALRADGFGSIFHLHRGILSWKAAGESIVSGSGA